MTTRALTYIERKGTDPSAGPLLILLHGYGSNEQDLFGLTPYFDDRYTIVSVRAPRTLGQGAYAWFDLGFTADNDITFQPEQVLSASQQLATFIKDTCATRQITSQQVTLLGFSQGAMMTALIALTQPQLIGRAVLLSGLVPPQAQDHLSDASRRAHLKLFVGHGLYDDVVPIEQGRATDALLTSLNLDHVYREYATTHSIHDECLDDILTWLDE